MKSSELIKKLEEMLEKHGDLNVCLFEHDDFYAGYEEIEDISLSDYRVVDGTIKVFCLEKK